MMEHPEDPQVGLDGERPFRILNLPQELRDMIWQYALVKTPPITVAFAELSEIPPAASPRWNT